MSHLISQTFATGADVERVINNMGELLQEEERPVILMACLSVCIMLQSPDITPEQLKDAVRDASQHIALYLSDLDDIIKEQKGEPMLPNKVN